MLAVGDESFRKKCIEKIQEMRDMGKTIVFVSHAMSDVKRLCDRAICLDQGQIIFEGNSADAADFYMEQISKEKA